MVFSQQRVRGDSSSIALLGQRSLPEDARKACMSVRPSVDPINEIRITLAQLTARAQKLTADDAHERVVCNGRRLWDVSKKQADDSQKLAKRVATGDIFSGFQGSVELFMSRYLNLDIREQQRLLCQLHTTQNQTAYDIGSAAALATYHEPLSDANSGIACSEGNNVIANDVDLFLEDLKNTVIAQSQAVLHRSVREQVMKRENCIFKAAWSTYYMRLADEAELFTMHDNDHASAPSLEKNKNVLALTNEPLGRSSVNILSQVLSSQSLVAEAIKHKIAAFATIVEHCPSAQWMMRFSAYVHDQRPCTEINELGLFYTTVERIFEPVQRRNMGSGILSYVAASQCVMEQKALTRFFTSVMRIDPSRTDELSNMPTARVLEMISRQTGTSDPWVHIFDALRIGRYDVALEASSRVGNKCLQSALKRLADVAPIERHCVPPMLDLRDLYVETHTIQNDHRHAVLFLLLNGSTGESQEACEQVLLRLCTKLAQSLEDVLWMRLFSIREAESSARTLTVQTLYFTQKIILDDLHDLVSMAKGDIVRLASFLIHALLPASGLRLFLENDATMYVDGLHLALCLKNCDILSCSSQEAPLDLSKHIQRYCSLVLLDMSCSQLSSGENYFPGVATFSYFHKTGFDEAFTQFCAKDSVAVQLFGHFNTFSGQGGLLLSPNSPPPSDELLLSITNTAELAATRNNFPLAIHLLLTQANSARVNGKHEIARRALQRAVQLICPAIAEAIHLSPREGHVAALLVQSKKLGDALHHVNFEELNDKHAEVTLPEEDLHTFHILCSMVDIYQAQANDNFEQALNLFFALPFIPQFGLRDVDRCVKILCGASIDTVTAAAAILPLAFHTAHILIEKYTERNDTSCGNNGIINVMDRRLLPDTDLPSMSANTQKAYHIVQAMKLVVEWVRHCASQSPNGAMIYGACTRQVMDFEQRYLA